VTAVEVLNEYPVGYVLEYSETSFTGSIGHLFRMDPNDWQDPTLNIAYSRGGSRGQTRSAVSVTCDPLVDATGQRVDCSERHTKCTWIDLQVENYFQFKTIGEGSKICPYSNMDELSPGAPHTKGRKEGSV
jgi:hypothetical protein